MAGSDSNRFWVSFKYERLPIFCYHYGLLGHDLNHCVSYHAISKNGGEVLYQYGDWLRATEPRSWSLPKRNSVRFSSSSTEGGTATNQEGRASDHLPAADTPFNASPCSNVTYQNSNNGNKGVTPKLHEFKEVDAGNYDLAKVMKEVNSAVKNPKEDNAEKYDSVTVIQEVNSGITALLEENESGRLHATQDGLNKPYCGPDKTKPKWTWVPRMDCGLWQC